MHCQAKRSFERIVSSVVSQSDDSIFCLITTFISRIDASSSRLRCDVFMKNLSEIICIFLNPLISFLSMGGSMTAMLMFFTFGLTKFRSFSHRGNVVDALFFFCSTHIASW